MRVAVVGATGALGGELLAVLDDSSLPITELVPIATDRSLGTDVEMRGATIEAGDGLLLAYASANRDPDHWGDSAEQFDITGQDAAGHLGFGVGEHFCMGAALARREARLLLEEIVKRASGLRVTGERVPRASALVHTHDHLPVVLNYR